MVRYTHLNLNEDVYCLAGYYIPQKEVILKHHDREVLYVVGRAVVDASCCGSGDWGYALVPGYIVSWQNRKDEAGLPVSEVEPITDEATRRDIRQVIQSSENAPQVDFW